MNWLRRFRDWLFRAEEEDAPTEPIPFSGLEATDWVVVPYRIAEACRISVYTIMSHPEVPDHVRNWIAQWLQQYNAALGAWFGVNYGPDVFPILAEITNAVRQASEQDLQRQVDESFQYWERQFNEGEDGGT